jgi:hypothetical protein
MDIPGSPLTTDHRRTNHRAQHVVGLLLFSPAPNQHDFRRLPSRNPVPPRTFNCSSRLLLNLNTLNLGYSKE